LIARPHRVLQHWTLTQLAFLLVRDAERDGPRARVLGAVGQIRMPTSDLVRRMGTLGSRMSVSEAHVHEHFCARLLIGPLEAIAGSDSFEIRDTVHSPSALHGLLLALSAMTRFSSSRRATQCGAGLAASQCHGQMCPRRVLHSTTNVTRAVGDDAVGASRTEARGRSALWRCSRAATTPTCRWTSGWR
jgi:hypothetical protein